MSIRTAIARHASYLLTSAIVLSIPSAAEAQGPTPAYLEVRPVPHGTVRTHAYKSKSLGTDRKVVVYTPPNYEASSDRFPVLYLLHGAGSTETSWTERGKAHVILDNLIADGRLQAAGRGDAFRLCVRAGGRDGPGRCCRKQAAARGLSAGSHRGRDSDDRCHIPRPRRPRPPGDCRPLPRRRAVAGHRPQPHQPLQPRGRLQFGDGSRQQPETGGVNFDEVLADSASINKQLKLLWVGLRHRRHACSNRTSPLRRSCPNTRSNTSCG